MRRHFAPALVLSLLDPKLSWDEAEVQASVQQGVEVTKADGTPLSPYDLKRLQVCCPTWLSSVPPVLSKERVVGETDGQVCPSGGTVSCRKLPLRGQLCMQSTCQPTPRADCDWVVTHNKADAQRAPQ